MKLELEIPKDLYDRLIAESAKTGVSVDSFVQGAISEQLPPSSSSQTKNWMIHFGALKDLRPETERIQAIIDRESRTTLT